MSISCIAVLTTVLQVPFLSAAVWRDGETLEEELMEAVMTDKVKLIIMVIVHSIRAVGEKEACGILQLQLGGSSKPLLAFFMRYFLTF